MGGNTDKGWDEYFFKGILGDLDFGSGALGGKRVVPGIVLVIVRHKRWAVNIRLNRQKSRVWLDS